MSEETKPFIEETSSIEKRLWRFLIISLVVMVVLSLIFAKIEFTTGILVGGILAIFNFRFLQNSVRGIFQTQSNQYAFKFIFRYFSIGLILLLFSFLEVVSFIGILIGISSFVAALMLEAIIQFYFVITKHEEL
ncbi:MAG: ATP synthase subunit I [Pyrinomonadaceae bacterium]|jgi:hypothetical protein|nr:ATP synthase subunit I [Pyrinomonadaceae bacterium]